MNYMNISECIYSRKSTWSRFWYTSIGKKSTILTYCEFVISIKVL